MDYGELLRENQAQRERLSRLNQASLRINEGLDVAQPRSSPANIRGRLADVETGKPETPD